MLPWSAELAGRLDEHVSSTRPAARQRRSATRTNGRCGSTCRPATTTTPRRATRASTSSRATPGTSRCGRTGTPYRQPFLETADAVFASGRGAGCVVVYVDAWTAYGGSQFVDSPGTGALPLVPVRRGRAVGRRALPHHRRPRVAGDQRQVVSGGFGAMITPMLRPDLFGALATHAGDTLYEPVYLPRVRRRRVRAPARLRRRHPALVGRLPVPHVLHQEGGRGRCSSRSACAACFSARDGRHARAAVRPAHRRAAARAVAALAGLGPGADGRRGTPTRCGRCGPCGSTPATRDEWYLDLGARGVPRRAAADRRARRARPLRAVRRLAHGASTTATRWRSRGSRERLAR